MAGQAIVTIRDKQWLVSLVNTPGEMAQGLGGIPELPPETGMLFDLGQEQTIQVTTIPMLFPLDIAFLSESLVITEVYRDVQPGYLVTSILPARYFLEVNSGEFEGIGSGDRVSIARGSFQEVALGETMITTSVNAMMGIMAFGIVGALAIGMVKPLSRSSEHRSNPLSVEEKRQACMRAIAQWYGTYRREMTDEELRPIVRKYYPTDRELKEFLHFLQSSEGEQAMREELRLEAWRRGLAGPPHSSNPGPLEELEKIARYAELVSRLSRSMRGATRKW